MRFWAVGHAGQSAIPLAVPVLKAVWTLYECAMAAQRKSDANVWDSTRCVRCVWDWAHGALASCCSCITAWALARAQTDKWRKQGWPVQLRARTALSGALAPDLQDVPGWRLSRSHRENSNSASRPHQAALAGAGAWAARAA